jgi:hypothetical protein
VNHTFATATQHMTKVPVGPSVFALCPLWFKKKLTTEDTEVHRCGEFFARSLPGVGCSAWIRSAQKTRCTSSRKREE